MGKTDAQKKTLLLNCYFSKGSSSVSEYIIRMLNKENGNSMNTSLIDRDT